MTPAEQKLIHKESIDIAHRLYESGNTVACLTRNTNGHLKRCNLATVDQLQHIIERLLTIGYNISTNNNSQL